MFLDLDGTLFDLVDRPDDVRADEPLRDLLLRVAERLGGRVALVSGRSIAQMDQIMGPLARLFVLAGSHGGEFRYDGVDTAGERPAGLDEALARCRAIYDETSGIIIEDKTLGVALHYRQAPHLEDEAGVLAATLAGEYGLALQKGKMMIELRAAGCDKGEAVRALMARDAMKGTRPIFIGDDLTDEPGFVAARDLGGEGVIVGGGRPTAASYKLASPAAVRAWLAGAAT